MIEMKKSGMIFGKQPARLYSIEWQKYGLPHVHILIPEHKITPDKIDYVCAEIPDPECDPELHRIVMSNTVHGPCGSIYPDSPCMEHGQCSRNTLNHLLRKLN